MTTTPDPKAVREIARELVLNRVKDLAQDDDAVFESVIERAGCISPGLSEQEALADDVLAEIGKATVTVSWPAEQPQNGGAPADLWWSFTGAADTCYLEHHDAGAYRECCMRAGLAYALKVRDQLAQENGQPQDERDGDDDVRAVARLQDALAAGGHGWGEMGALIARFAARIAALDAREAQAGDER